jgi:hypothetical protein
VCLLRASEVLPAALVVAVLEVLTEEAAMTVEVAEATDKLKEKVSEEGLVWTFFFCPIFVNSNPDFQKLL